MSRFFSALSFLILAAAVGMPSCATASTVDLSISASSIRFSEETLIAGDTVRIYATINNVGDVDSTAQVFFYQGASLIGKSQPVSVIANGGKDDVFVDFVLPSGSFNIRAVIQGASPADQNAANNEAVTKLFKTIADTDRDGVIDDDDNCVDIANSDQADFDADNQGDVCDDDIDNDGVLNTDDDYPRDPSLTKLVVVTYGPEESTSETEVEPAPEPAPIQPAPEPVAQVAVKTEPVPQAVVVDAVTSATSEEDSAAPTPEVQGVQEDTATDAVQVALDFSGLASGRPVQLSSARFTYSQINWRTYEFSAIPPVGGGSYTFAWDFGDGATSVQSTIQHKFPASGVYTVTLGVIDEAGNIASDAETVRVSFFHLSNPLLLATLGVLIAILLGLLVMVVRLRRGEEL